MRSVLFLCCTWADGAGRFSKVTPGNRGLFVLRRTEGTITHFLIPTLWDSIDCIKRFTGEAYEQAQYYPELKCSTFYTNPTR